MVIRRRKKNTDLQFRIINLGDAYLIDDPYDHWIGISWNRGFGNFIPLGAYVHRQTLQVRVVGWSSLFTTTNKVAVEDAFKKNVANYLNGQVIALDRLSWGYQLTRTKTPVPVSEQSFTFI